MQFEEIIQNRLDEKILYGEHESGLKIYIMPKKNFNKFYALYATEYGSYDNNFTVNGQNFKVPDGVAHFLEHKLFESEETSAFSSFAETGALTNAYTDFNMTAYLFSASSYFYENLESLIDFVNNPYFTELNVAKEIGIIEQEIKMCDDDPAWRVFFNLLNGMYKNNPLNIDICGTIESINKITPDLLYSCYNTFYNSKNMFLTIVGDVQENRVVESVEKYIKTKKTKFDIIRNYPIISSRCNKNFLRQRMSVEFPLFEIGFKHERLFKDDILKTEIIHEVVLEILFGNASDFYKEMYEKNLIDESFYTTSNVEKIYNFTVIGGKSKNPYKVHEFVIKEFKKALKDGIDKVLIDVAKRYILGSHIKIYDNFEDVGNMLVRTVIRGVNLFDSVDILENINQRDVMEALNDFDLFDNVLSVVEPL